MRDYRDAKAMARTLRTALAAKGLKISIGESLELVAHLLGARDWNALAAMIRTDPAEPPKPPVIPPPAAENPPDDLRRSSPWFSPALEASLRRAVAASQARKHEYTTLEHLLLALIEDADAAAVMAACRVDIGELRQGVTGYIDTELSSLRVDTDDEPAPTAGLQRALQRAVIHVRTAGRTVVTGANALVAIFSERESHACWLLLQQGMTRFDAVNFIAHGIVKGGGNAAA